MLAQRLPISYVPQENVQPVKDADAVSVEVQVEDLQPNTFNHFSNFLNPLGDRRYVAPFLVKDAAETVEQAAESELKARGFRIADGAHLIAIQVIHFEGDYISGSWQLHQHRKGQSPDAGSGALADRQGSLFKGGRRRR